MSSGPISEIGGAPTSAALAAEYLHVVHVPPLEAALAAAKAEEQLTTEQRVAEGDPIAQAQLAQQEKRITPIESEQLLPLPPNQQTGVREIGKGTLVDVYD